MFFMKNRTTLFLLFIGCVNIYYSQSVIIGKQVWMSKNLDVSTFRNGDPIPEAKTEEEWRKAGENKQPAWCYYESKPLNGMKYGKLYNWYAVNDPRGLAPAGWHIPTEDEWKVLVNYLGGESVAGGKMKSAGTKYWKGPNTGATNESGFLGFPGGSCDEDGSFYRVNDIGIWWSASAFSDTEVWSLYLYHDGSDIGIYNYLKEAGRSVRCLKD